MPGIASIGVRPSEWEDTVPSQPEKESEYTAISVVWPDNVELPTVYANHLYIQHTNNEFFLIFGELQLPMALGSPDERREKLERFSEVTIRPVAKIAVSPPAMLKIAEIIQQNVEGFRNTVDQLKPENGDNQ
jgi:hypothetical protein